MRQILPPSVLSLSVIAPPYARGGSKAVTPSMNVLVQVRPRTTKYEAIAPLLNMAESFVGKVTLNNNCWRKPVHVVGRCRLPRMEDKHGASGTRTRQA